LDAIEDDEFFAKRINGKILRLRSDPKPKFEAEEFKSSVMRDMSKSKELSEFRQSLSKMDASSAKSYIGS